MATNESWSSFTAFLHRRLYMTPRLSETACALIDDKRIYAS